MHTFKIKQLFKGIFKTLYPSNASLIVVPFILFLGFVFIPVQAQQDSGKHNDYNTLAAQVGLYKIDGFGSYAPGLSASYTRKIFPWLHATAGGRFWQNPNIEIWNDVRVINPAGGIGSVSTVTANGGPAFLYSFAQVEAGAIFTPFTMPSDAPLSDLRIGIGASYQRLAAILTSYALVVPLPNSNDNMLVISNYYTQLQRLGVWVSLGYGFELSERVTLGIDAAYHDYLRQGLYITFYGISATLSVSF